MSRFSRFIFSYCMFSRMSRSISRYNCSSLSPRPPSPRISTLVPFMARLPPILSVNLSLSYRFLVLKWLSALLTSSNKGSFPLLDFTLSSKVDERQLDVVDSASGRLQS